MRRIVASSAGIALVLTVAACGRKEQPRPATTERQRDSVLGASKVPGAGGVGAALRVSDSAAAHQAQVDSVGQ